MFLVVALVAHFMAAAVALVACLMARFCGLPAARLQSLLAVVLRSTVRTTKPIKGQNRRGMQLRLSAAVAEPT